MFQSGPLILWATAEISPQEAEGNLSGLCRMITAPGLISQTAQSYGESVLVSLPHISVWWLLLGARLPLLSQNSVKYCLCHSTLTWVLCEDRAMWLPFSMHSSHSDPSHSQDGLKIVETLEFWLANAWSYGTLFLPIPSKITPSKLEQEA